MSQFPTIFLFSPGPKSPFPPLPLPFISNTVFSSMTRYLLLSGLPAQICDIFEIPHCTHHSFNDHDIIVCYCLPELPHAICHITLWIPSSTCLFLVTYSWVSIFPSCYFPSLPYPPLALVNRATLTSWILSPSCQVCFQIWNRYLLLKVWCTDITWNLFTIRISKLWEIAFLRNGDS